MVSALHGRPPLCLSVTPAISPEEKRRQKREKEEGQRFLEEVGFYFVGEGRGNSQETAHGQKCITDGRKLSRRCSLKSGWIKIKSKSVNPDHVQ